MSNQTKAELLAENENLLTRIALLERAKKKGAARAQELKNLRAELIDAEQRQAATAEILRVIASSPDDVQPVFDSIVRSCRRLFGGQSAALALLDNGKIVLRAGVDENGAPMPLDLLPPWSHDRESATGAAVLDARPINLPDLAQSVATYPRMKDLALRLGYQSGLWVPLRREGGAIGVINVLRRATGQFTDQEVALAQTFADQAVIAIENVRLFNETKESLARQTATAEILKVIGGSMTDTQPVFDAIVENCRTLFKDSRVALWLSRESELVRIASTAGAAESMPIDRASAIGVCVLDGHMIHLPDLEAAAEDYPRIRNLGLKSGYRSGIYAPLLRAGRAIGGLSVLRYEAGAFDDKAMALLGTFADQAVIAIENVRLFNETKEALERQIATSEILRVISESPTSVRPVFDAIVAGASRLCSSDFGGLFLVKSGQLVPMHTPANPQAAQFLESNYPRPVDATSLVGRSILEKCVIHVPDLDDPATGPRFASKQARPFRSQLTVPLMREGEAIGAIVATRRQSSAFTDSQIELVKTFAGQAVIAIENVRLFNETKEALERQTATAEILRVIASSPTDVQPVFDAIAQSAKRLFDGHATAVTRVVGDVIQLAAMTGAGKEGDESLKRLFPAPVSSPANQHAKVVRSGVPAFVTDYQTDTEVSPQARDTALAAGYRSVLVVPMLRDGVAIGSIAVTRRDPGQFTEHQVSLLQTFADQAVIAIENVRLFNETQEALERQTATAEILKVIASSPSDVQPVFDAIVNSAARLFDPCSATIAMREGGLMHWYATAGADYTQEHLERLKNVYPLPFDPERSPSSRSIVERRIIEIMDAGAPDAPVFTAQAGKAFGFRTGIFVPLIRDGEGIGTIILAHPEPGFKLSANQLALAQTFADQAVIAIENVRLFKELESRTAALSQSVGQLTALGEVGQAISSTLDLDTVLKTIVSRALQLTGLDGGSMYEYDERAEVFRMQVSENMAEELLQVTRNTPIRLGDGAVGRTGVTREPVQVPDTLDDSYQSERKELLIRSGYRAVLAVPLLREDNLLGALLVTRKTPGPFAKEVVDLLKTFATQSAMAIQNARLFREIAEKGKQLEIASHHKSDFLASMSHELRTPLNAILGFNELILAEIYGPVPEDMKVPLIDIQSSGKHLLRLINNVLDLAKIEAGRMELALADYSVHDTVESVRSTLRPLAAEKGLEFLATVPEEIPIAYGDYGRITQCLMNLAGNSLKFTKTGKVEIVVALNGDVLMYRVNDTGIGIPPDKIASLFTEFKQTDATIASEYGGTGLGLSISKKFIEMHGGRIWIESELGRGSSFIFEVPLRVTTTAGAGS